MIARLVDPSADARALAARLLSVLGNERALKKCQCSVVPNELREACSFAVRAIESRPQPESTLSLVSSPDDGARLALVDSSSGRLSSASDKGALSDPKSSPRD